MKYFRKKFGLILLDTYHLFYIMFPFFNWRIEIELYTQYLTPLWLPFVCNHTWSDPGQQEMYNALKEYYIDWLWFFIRIAYPLERRNK